MRDQIETMIDKLERQTFLNMSLRKAVLLFSAVFFLLIVFFSAVSYYFAMKKALNDSLDHELSQIVDTRQIKLSAKLDKEILITRILAESPVIKAYFLDPQNEQHRNAAFKAFDDYKNFLSDKLLNWINIHDLNYYVNGQLMEKYDSANANHQWFFKALNYQNPPLIEVDYDYLNRGIYDIYINFPVYESGTADVPPEQRGMPLGVISSRISLSDFIASLNLTDNIYVFDKDGVIIGAKDAKIVKEKRTVKDLFNGDADDILSIAKNIKEGTSVLLTLGNERYAVSSANVPDLYLAAGTKVDLQRIMSERTTIIFIALLILILFIFIVFNRFIFLILNPMSKKMQVYIESSLVDELTKLPNRRFLNARLEDEWNRSVRGKTPISFLMMDLDKFKNYNDTFGHLEGDLLLQLTAEVLNSCASRLSDFIARIGGEEFCVLLPNTDINGAKKLAEQIRAAMENTRKATISIGIASIVPTLENSIHNFMNTADANLYKAKNSGRNKVVG